MGFRFQRRIKIAPGLSLNLSKSGFSLTGGVKGLSVNVGRRGGFLNAGVPGTGLSTRTKLGGAAGGSGQSLPSSGGELDVRVRLTDDGHLHYENGAGQPLTRGLITKVRREARDQIEAMLASASAERNADREALGRLHLQTPGPRTVAAFHPAPEPRPPAEIAPVAMPWWLRILVAVLPFLGRRHEARAAVLRAGHEEEQREFAARLAAQRAGNARAREHFEAARRGEPEPMAELLEAQLGTLVWTRETLVDFEIAGPEVWLDVDLPEIEDFPHQEVKVAGGLRGLRFKDLSDTAVRKDYMQHVHAIAFRLVGEVFHRLPAAARVVVSGYSQRLNEATGHRQDQYLYSVRVDRGGWSRINFEHLDQVNVVEALGQFEIRRKMTKTGLFKPIEPFALGD